MIFGEGLFQADGHPGNILIGKGGRVGLLDYGQSKQLPDKDREAFARLVLALTRCGVVAGGDGGCWGCSRGDKDREAFARLVLALTRCGAVAGGDDGGWGCSRGDKDREAFACLVLALTRCGVVGGGEVRGRTSLKVGGDQGRGFRAEGIRVSTLEN